MLGGREKKLADRLVERIIESPSTIKTLIAELTEGGPSSRAIYKAIANLLRDGVLVKVGKVVRMNPEWRAAASNLLHRPSTLRLNPGERLAYRFASIANLQAYFQEHASSLRELERDGQIFFYTPHNFWIYLPAQQKCQETYHRHFTEQKLHAFFTVGESMAADRSFKHAYQSEFLQIHTEHRAEFPRTNHVAVLAEHILSIRLPRQVAGAIDALYASGREVADFLPELLTLLQKPAPIHLLLEHNGARARALKRSLSLPFYFWKPQ